MKKKIFLSLMLCLGIILGCCFSFNSKIESAYADEPVNVDSFYLVNGDSFYRSNTAIGFASGYGNYKLGDKNIALVAGAKDGYKIAGWKIVLLDQNNKVEYITNSKTITSVSEQDIALQGSLTFDSEQTVEYNGENVSMYTNATDGVNTYVTLYKTTSNRYFVLNYNDVEFTVTNNDGNSDGYFDESVLQISEVFENITVEPVFDFVYYQVEITDLIDKIKLPNLLMNDFSGYSVYGDADGTEDGYTKIVNTVIKNGSDNYFYIGDCYIKDGKANAKHLTLQDEPTAQYVDMIANNGAFRLNQNITTSFDINIVDNAAETTKDLSKINESVNVDVLGVSIGANTTRNLTKVATISDNSFVKTTDTYGRTSKLDIKFNISTASNLINNLTLNSHKLYVVDLNRTIDGKTAAQVGYSVNYYESDAVPGIANAEAKLYSIDDEFFTILNNVRVPVQIPEGTTLGTPTVLQVNDIDQFFKISNNGGGAFIKVSFHFSAVSDTIYLVKNAADNAGHSFEISCSSTYSEVSLGDRYYYYNFNNLAGTPNSKQSFSSFNSNKTINIDYVKTSYNVNFETAIIKDGAIVPFVLDNNIDSISLVHGESKTITDYGTNKGYSFVGYALNTNEDAASLQNSIIVKMNNINPDDITVYVVYEHEKYSLNIHNLKSIELNGNYPLNLLTINHTKNGVTTKNEVEINTVTTYSNLNIGDELSFTYKVSTGFVFNAFVIYKPYSYTLESWAIEKLNLYIYDEVNSKYELNTNETYSSTTDYFVKEEVTTLALTEEFLNGLKSTIIDIYADLDYVRYTITYKLESVAPNTGESEILMADVWATIGSNTEKIYGSTNGEGDYEIVLDNLKLNDIVYLNSQGYTFTDSNGQTKRYAFNWFTVNGRDELSKSVDGEEVYTHEEEVFTTRTIWVVYSMPITQIAIKLNNANAFSLYEGDAVKTFNVVARVGETELTPLLDEFGNLSFKCSLNDEVTITVDKNKIKTGYILSPFTIENNVLTAENLSSFSCGFKAVDGIQTVTINFKAIEYRFIVVQNGAGFNNTQYTQDFEFNDVEGTVNDYYYTVLTVENKTLNINKPIGYFVSEVAVNLNTNLYTAMNQTNASKLEENIVLYSYTFTDQEFIDFVGTYGDLTDNLKVITLMFNYEIYVYDVSVSYTLINGNYDLDSITKPGLALVYGTGNTNIEPEYKNASNTLVFKNIPYGEVVNLGVVSEPTLGVAKMGWFTAAGDEIISDELVISIENFKIPAIASDYDLTYKLKYIEYTIFLNYDENAQEGAPIVLVNMSQTNQVILGNMLEIQSNAIRTNGYTFDCMMYKYAHNDEVWATEWDKLYVQSGSGYVLNTESEYNSEETYFVKYSDVSFETTFDVKNFVVDTNASGKPIINFYLYYRLLQISILNTNTENIAKGSISNLTSVFKDMHIAYEDYAIYTVYKKAIDANGEPTWINNYNNKVTAQDIVKIEIQVNANAQNRKIKTDEFGNYILVDGNYEFEYINEFYDLTQGLKLYSLNIYSYNFTDEGDGKYTIELNIKQLLSDPSDYTKLDEDDNLNLEYSYQVEQKTLTVTTNINDSSFYKDRRMGINEGKYGSASTKYSVATEVEKQHTMQFLAKGFAKCYLDDLKNYFKVIDINVYENNKLVSEDLYPTYGIEKSYYTATEMEAGNKGLNCAYVRFIKNIKIEFVVQPILYFEGNEVVSEDYTFYREYKCNNQAEGQINQLTPKQAVILPTVDITLPSIVPTTAVTITYKQFEDGVEKIVDPVNVGKYSVHIKFNSVSGYTWLKEITIPINVYLEITPKTLFIETIDIDEYISREYDGSSAVGGINGVNSIVYNSSGEQVKAYKNINDILKYLVLTDRKDVEINYSYIIENNLFNNYICLNSSEIVSQVTKTVINIVTLEEVEEAVKDAYESYYNITLTNVSLDSTKDFNANFALFMQEGETSISKTIKNIMQITPRKVSLNMADIAIEDKLEDGTLNAKFASTTQFNLQNVVAGDSLYIVESRVVAEYDSANYGKDKVVTIDPTLALDGINPKNYYIETSTIENKVIYRYSIPVQVEGVGTFVLYNKRGLTDPSKANLIPFGAVLKIETVENGTSEFMKMYQYIEQYISGTRDYCAGYKLKMEVYGVAQPISNELFLSIPVGAKEIVSLIELTGEQTLEVNYTNDGGNIIVDLANINLNIDTFVLLEKKALLKLWQIILIIAGGVVVFGGVVTAVVIIRVRKTRKNELLEKI